MGLTKQKLGRFIERIECRNSDLQFGIDNVRGISNSKEIQQTKSDISDRSFTRFQIVKPREFVFNRRTTRMGEKIGLGYNNIDEVFIVTEDYVVFRVSDESTLLPDYLNLFFHRPEFDRYARWDSWGSATEFFNWEEMCDVPIAIPPLHVQQKCVDVYNAMLANQRSYENGLENLKLTCDATIEDLRREMPSESIGKYIEQRNEKNNGSVKHAQGININKAFITPQRLGENLIGARVVRKGQFAYCDVMHKPDSKMAIALRKDDDCVVSATYKTFEVIKPKELLSDYLMMWFERSEFDRYAAYNSFGSARPTFDFSEMHLFAIPIPKIETQQAIVDIYNAYIIRRDINEKLKTQLKDICPILIKGSLEEAKKA